MITHRLEPPIALGQSDFRRLRTDGAYYVDKSLFIQDVIECSYQTMLLPRPRRFGKTLNLSMLRYFFEKHDEDRRGLFDGTAIRETTIFSSHQGQYPVIFMTFKDIKRSGWADCLQNIRNVLYDALCDHRYLLDSPALFPEEKAYLQKIIEERAEMTECEQFLKRLSAYLSRHHEQQTVILIDEYDTPIHAGYDNGYYDEIIGFMRNFLSGGFKDNAQLFKGVLTGILRVAKESIFSGLNNLGVYTLLTQDFNRAFGFTEQETSDLLRTYHLDDRYEKVASWYNGYYFGGEVIYNPWSVLNYVASSDHALRPYWLNTGSTDLIERLITRGGQELREEFFQLLEGEIIIKPISDTIVMRDLDCQEHLVWSFLLFSGYLKWVEQLSEEDYALQIPNREVWLIFRQIIKRWFNDKLDLSHLQEMLNALKHGDMSLFERTLRQVILEVMSYHDLAGEPEKVYQALVLGMLVWLSHDYTIRTNRESGYGRYDMLFIPKDATQHGIIIELKRVEQDEKPETVLKQAMKQIEKKRYAVELEAAGVQDIIKIAVAFRGKEMWMTHRSTQEHKDEHILDSAV